MSFRSLASAFVLIPLAYPLLIAIAQIGKASSWSALAELDRLVELFGTTVALCTLTCLFALPLGIALAVLLFRTNLPGRKTLRTALALAIFVPLPLFALAWQSIGGGGWRPWTQGLLAAAIIHALAALPWVVGLTGLALLRVEPELEDQARTFGNARAVLFRITLRRAWPGIALAAAWIVLQAAGEIAVTDLVVTRTFAEEVYTQFVIGGRPDSLGRAVVVALPQTVIACLAVGWLVRRHSAWLSTFASVQPNSVWQLGSARRLLFVATFGFVFAYLGVPLFALLLQAAGGESGSAGRVFIELLRTARLNGFLILDSLACAVLAGLIAGGLAMIASISARDSRLFRTLLFVLAVALWATPGPVLGFGLKEGIALLMKIEDALLAGSSVRPLQDLLYFEPNPLPVLWAHVARLFPYAVAILWPAVRDVPRDLLESARVDGATRWLTFRTVIWPATRSAFWLAVLAVAALAMGELAASKLVQIPGRTTFVQELFNQMHYGATPTTAALALLQMLAAFAVWSAIVWRWTRAGISCSASPKPEPRTSP